MPRARLSEMSLLRRTTVVLAAAGVALAATACAGGDSTSPAQASAPASSAPPALPPATPGKPAGAGQASPARPGWPASGPNLRVLRSGGFAGVDQTVVVNPSGSWTYRDRRKDGPTRRGRLAPGDLSKLRSLLSGPELAREARAKRLPPMCADGFAYMLTFGELTIGWTACGGGNEPETAAAIAELVMSHASAS